VARGLVPSFLAACAMATLLWLAREAIMLHFSSLMRMSIMTAMGAALYPIFLCLFGRNLVRETLAEFTPVRHSIMRKFSRR
jgi:hypothetical protein